MVERRPLKSDVVGSNPTPSANLMKGYMFASCRLCGKSLDQIKGYLKRDLPKEIPSTWTCRPSCEAKLTSDEAVLAAINNDTSLPALSRKLANWPFPEISGKLNPG